MKLNIAWTDDCQGKKDYDGNIVAISTRYWPGNYQANGICSAKCHISLYDGDLNGESEELISQEFVGESFIQVAEQVESWAHDQMVRAVKALKSEFSK